MTQAGTPTGTPTGAGTTVRYVVTDECTACGACLLTCPEHAITPSLPLQVQPDRCTDCGECIEVCPRDALLRIG